MSPGGIIAAFEYSKRYYSANSMLNFLEVLLADALTSALKVLKDLAT
jgi:hypothetical protein